MEEKGQAMNINEIDNETRIDQQEWLILQVELHIEKLMEEKEISRAELARRLGKKKGHITQLLSGHNMTLRTIADIMTALDSSLVIDTDNLGYHTTIKPEDKTSNLKFSKYNLRKAVAE